MTAEAKVNILLVDDQPANLTALEAILDDLGQTLVKAATGHEALRCLGQHDFAVVLLDVNLPDLDGFSIARQLRLQERTRYTPIIFITAMESQESAVIEAYELGAVDYLTKPIIAPILRGKVSGFIDLFRKTRLIEQQGEALRRAERAEFERRLAHEQALRESDERFRRMVAGIKDYAIFLLDPRGHITTWNAGAERIKGYRPEEVIGRHFSLFYPPEDVQAGKPDRLLKVAATVGQYEEEGWRLRKDGSRFWASVLLTALRDEAGNLQGFSKVTRDVSERRRAEKNARLLIEEQAARKAAEANAEESRRAERAIRGQREQLRVTLRSIGDAVVATDARGHLTYMNPIAERLTGWREVDAVGKPLADVFIIINERTRKRVDDPVAKVLIDGKAVGLANHTVLMARDGSERPIDDSAAPILQDNKIIGVVLVFRDVTEKRRSEQAALDLAAIVESTDDAIISKTLEGIVTSWNQGAERLFGYTPAEMVGKPIALLLPPDRPNEEAEILERLNRGERVDHFETVRVRKDGTPLEISATISPIRDSENHIVGVSKIARDITDRKRLERDLQERVQQLAEADQQKDNFLAMLAHELRNPLAPIRNALRVQQLATDAATVSAAREMMERQVQHLHRLVDDLLDVSRVLRGKVAVRRERLDFASVVRHACEDRRTIMEEAGLKLVVNLPATPVWIAGDSTRLVQVVSNLLDNATKFRNGAGEVQVRLAVEGQQAILRVRDAGVGLEPGLLRWLFHPFAQGDRSLDRSRGGLGLGLALVKGLAELHGGQVEAASEGPGKGATFTVRLPIKEEAPAVTRTPAAVTAAPRRRVLVIEDNRDAADSLKMLLELQGHEVAVAYTGPEGVRRALEWRPEIVLCDIGLPGLDGYGVAQALRGDPTTAGAYLIAVTGYGQEQDRLRSKDAGFDRHFVKPVEPEELSRAVGCCQLGQSC